MSDLSEGLDWALENKGAITTIYDNLSWMWKPRETIVETPRVGYPEGQDSANTNNTIERAADVITMGKDFYTQVKGLFGLGYPATETQPVSGVQHEVTPAALPVVAGMSAGTIAIIVIALILLFK